ncbi:MULTISPECIES: hypothetical protein [Streptomyces]|uniref:hypothetical protein n=1 Tax=Streptomyces TaxID=1883 RepID=UPI00332592D9|nr:hypothetical protein OG323_11385 [Streptomyces cyaneofuscatus]
MSRPLTRLRVRGSLALGAAEIRLRLRLPRLMWVLTRRPADRESPFAELVRIEADPAYRALFFAGLDAALEDRLATRTAVVAEIEAAAEQLRDLVQRSDHERAA